MSRALDRLDIPPPAPTEFTESPDGFAFFQSFGSPWSVVEFLHFYAQRSSAVLNVPQDILNATREIATFCGGVNRGVQNSPQHMHFIDNLSRVWLKDVPLQYAVIQDLAEAHREGLWLLAGYSLIDTEHGFHLLAMPQLHFAGISDVRPQRRLHNETGMAVEWKNGRGLYLWRGVVIDGRFVMDKDSITAEEIAAIRNIEQRRASIEALGTERTMNLMKPTLMHRDTFGELYAMTQLHDQETYLALKVRDASTDREYFLRVPPSMRRARQAVAWTFALTEQEYQPGAQA